MERVLTLGLDTGADVVSGWVRVEDADARPFAGYVELITLLEGARVTSAPPPRAPAALDGPGPLEPDAPPAAHPM